MDTARHRPSRRGLFVAVAPLLFIPALLEMVPFIVAAFVCGWLSFVVLDYMTTRMFITAAGVGEERNGFYRTALQRLGFVGGSVAQFLLVETPLMLAFLLVLHAVLPASIPFGTFGWLFAPIIVFSAMHLHAALHNLVSL